MCKSYQFLSLNQFIITILILSLLPANFHFTRQLITLTTRLRTDIKSIQKVRRLREIWGTDHRSANRSYIALYFLFVPLLPLSSFQMLKYSHNTWLFKKQLIIKFTTYRTYIFPYKLTENIHTYPYTIIYMYVFQFWTIRPQLFPKDSTDTGHNIIPSLCFI